MSARMKCVVSLLLAIMAVMLMMLPVLRADDIEVNRPTKLTTTVRVSTQFDRSGLGSNNLSSVTGLSVAVVAGRTYRFRGDLYVTADAVGGHKYSVQCSSCAATSVDYTIETFDITAKSIKAAVQATALATTLGEASGTSYHTVITGTIVVSTSGTIAPNFAQNVANTGTSSVLINSTWSLEDIT